MRYGKIKNKVKNQHGDPLWKGLYSTLDCFCCGTILRSHFFKHYKNYKCFLKHFVWPHRPPGAGGGPHEAKQEADGHPHPGFRIRVWDHRPSAYLDPKLSNRRVWLAGRSYTNLKIKVKALIIFFNVIFHWVMSCFLVYVYSILLALCDLLNSLWADLCLPRIVVKMK